MADVIRVRLNRRIGKPIPPAYATELQTVFNALNDMKQSRVEWDCGTTGVGVLVSDSLMFQRGQPTPSDPHLGNVYGLAMPLLKHGLPVTPVQLENVTVPHYLDGFRVLLLSYDGQKPLSPEVHAPLAAWVKQGGVLVVCDQDADPYIKVRDWWNSGGLNYATPREPLFKELGLDPQAEPDKIHPVGKGGVLWLRERPAQFSADAAGAGRVVDAARQAAKTAGIAWRETNYLLLRRGPYLIGAGLDESIEGAPHAVNGRFVNLFDPDLRVRREVVTGTRFAVVPARFGCRCRERSAGAAFGLQGPDAEANLRPPDSRSGGGCPHPGGGAPGGNHDAALSDTGW